MTYTKKDIIVGCSFKRSPSDNNRLVCIKVTENTSYFEESNTKSKWDYSHNVVLNHINKSELFDFQKYKYDYEIY